MHLDHLRQKFEQLFGRVPQIYRAPGRVNLIGEHTDYNDGFVLPAAIDFATYVAIAPNGTRALRIHSVNAQDTVEYPLDSAKPAPRHDWSDYVCGVAYELMRRGHRLVGADLLIDGEVPIGAGLSSSAALEMSTGLALVFVSGEAVERTELALAGQAAEHNWVGANVGIMDQWVSLNAKAGHALLLDCRTLKSRPVPIPPGVTIVICNSMVKHEIAAGEYNKRRAQCEEVVRRMKPHVPGVKALRDVTLADLELRGGGLELTVFNRARHVIEENERTLQAADCLQQGDLQRFGELMVMSHHSLRDYYEVSCDELDLLVQFALEQGGVWGARMTGGGFGGCTVNIVDNDAVDTFRRQVAQSYARAVGKRPDIYVTSAAEGAGRVA